MSRKVDGSDAAVSWTFVSTIAMHVSFIGKWIFSTFLRCQSLLAFNKKHSNGHFYDTKSITSRDGMRNNYVFCIGTA